MEGLTRIQLSNQQRNEGENKMNIYVSDTSRMSIEHAMFLVEFFGEDAQTFVDFLAFYQGFGQ